MATRRPDEPTFESSPEGELLAIPLRAEITETGMQSRAQSSHPSNLEPALFLGFLVPLGTQLRRGIVELSISPVMECRAIAVVIRVRLGAHQVENIQLLGQSPSLGLGQIHQWRVNAEIAFHRQ